MVWTVSPSSNTLLLKIKILSCNDFFFYEVLLQSSDKAHIKDIASLKYRQLKIAKEK